LSFNSQNRCTSFISKTPAHTWKLSLGLEQTGNTCKSSSPVSLVTYLSHRTAPYLQLGVQRLQVGMVVRKATAMAFLQECSKAADYRWRKR
jgi:hypothetical protein